MEAIFWLLALLCCCVGFGAWWHRRAMLLLQAELLASRRKYEELLEAANSVILRWNAQGIILEINEYGARLFGYERQELEGKTLQETILALEDAQGRSLHRLLAPICNESAAYALHVNETVRKDGQRLWLSWSNRVRRDAGGAPREVLSTGYDITEIKKAEQILREREERFRVMVEITPYPLVLCSLESQRILYANERAAELLGCSQSQLVGLQMASFYRQASEWQKLLREVQKRSFIRSVQLQLQRSDGSLFWALLSATAATYQDEAVVLVGISDISERKRLEEELERRATTDSLTGLVNRGQFMQTAETEWERARRYQYDLSLLVLDLDHFKVVNDTYGHPAGDCVLQAVSARMGQELRAADVLGRIGGEEFAVLLPETPLSEALGVAERLRAAVESVQVPLADGRTAAVTVSIGVAVLKPADLELDMLLCRADRALYAAKGAGRNCVRA